MMKTPTKFIALLSGAALLASSAFAQGVATNPVGYVTVEAKNGSDTYVGLTLTKASDLTTSVASVSGLDINVTESVAGSFAFTHYVLFSSGSQAGQWFEVTANDAGSLTLSGGEGVTDLGVDLGILADDAFKVIGFWEVNQVFPDGVGFAASADVFGPTSLIFINNLEAAGTNLSAAGSYFYHDGSSGFKAAGWYENGTLANSNDLRLSPDTYFTIRNSSGADFSFTLPGNVPVDVIGTSVLSDTAAQDNQLVNPYPADLTLATSGLTDVVAVSANVFGPTDLVFLLDNDTVGTNKSALASYFYHDGSSGFKAAGWYENGTLTAADSIVIPAGAAFVVRKAAGAVALAAWNPPAPYSL
jgi:uncharacterized protein (TIGR02597 family)